MVTALIAEDEPVLADALCRQLGQLWPELRVINLARDGQQACQIALNTCPDVLFLDIHMPGANGLDVAERVVEGWPLERPLPLIVFITAYDDYAIQAFDRAAVDYVLKPVRPDRLALTCQRLQTQLALQREAGAHTDEAITRGLVAIGTPPSPPATGAGAALKLIQAAAGQSVYLIPIEDVAYFEAADKYVRVISTPRDPGLPERLIRTPLRELLPRLDPALFWQVHRSVVVNVRAIERISRHHNRTRIHLRGHPDTLDVSRMYAHLFKAM